MTPKQCTCGRQGYVIDSRQCADHVMRRYACECGAKWTSAEIRLQDGVHGKDLKALLAKQFSTVDRENVADRLIEMAQELLN